MNKKTKAAIIGIIALVLVTIGASYAYWLITRTQSGENVITTGCLDITLNGENDITLENQFPLSDEDGAKLTPYTFTVTNNCNTSVDYHVNLESIGTESTALAPTSIKAVLNENTPKVLYDYVGASTTVSGAYEAYTLGYGTLTAKSDDTTTDEVTYSLRLWIDEDAPISEMNKTYTGKISVMIGQGVSAQGSELASLILEDAETNNYLYTTTPDFNSVTADGEYGLYTAEDDYGTSYYFRGDVENNYVKFGKYQESNIKAYAEIGTEFSSLEECESSVEHQEMNMPCEEYVFGKVEEDMYWRIVRINGDGTIRLIYDGMNAVANSEKHISIINNVIYNEYNGKQSVGYTYDASGAQVDSVIKASVDDWYETNLESKYSKYIADEIFCNDRKYEEVNSSYKYAAYNRLEINKTPTIVCNQDADKYTVSNTKGNGLLDKPVGLITADEIVLAGGKIDEANTSFYLYSGLTSDFSLSPRMDHVFFIIEGSGSFSSIGLNFGTRNVGARPVINLKADVLFEGNGTIDSPYEIVTE